MNRGGAEVEIRSVTAADLERIKDIDRVLVGPDRVLSWPLTAEANWWVKRPKLNFVAEIGGEVVGFLLGDVRAVEYGTDTSGWIDIVGVAPEYQGRGIGRRLVEAFGRECQRDGVKARVVIREDDEQLVGFWTAVGFLRGKLVSYER